MCHAADMTLHALAIALCVWLATPAAPDSTYLQRTPSRDGTGKIYMGREISEVMGHRGADWLERPGREQEEAPDVLVRELRLQPDDVVADIGAGTGYFTFRMSALVPRGRVLAVDIQPEMLDLIRERSERDAIDNVEPVLGRIDDPSLPEAGVDVVLIVDAYHEFSHPMEMMRGIVRGLRPGGRVVLVEYREEDPDVPIKPLHKMSEAQARREMAAAGLVWVETRDVLPRQHLMIFQKPGGNDEEDRRPD
jgi:SAM-dependent methyltransferase